MCSDQGLERLIVDSPNIDQPDEVEAVLDQHRPGALRLLASEPDKHFMPNAVLMSGPLHVVRNAYKAAIKSAPGWDEYKEVFSAMLALLGQKGLRDRFL